MEPTLGGAVAMNVHGKNNWRRGVLGEHCLELDLLLPDGELRTLAPASDRDLLLAVIGSFGQLGVITRARLKLKPVSSGLLHVRATAAPDLESTLRMVDEAKDRWEYVVGWIDAFARGRRLGRGLLHFARHLEPGEDASAAQSLRAEAQDLPDTMFGLLPKTMMWRLEAVHQPARHALRQPLGRPVGSMVGDGAEYRQSLAEFSFLLDSVPHWRNVYLPGGLIQHQSMVPVADAEKVFGRQLEAAQRRRMPPFLAVLKRHRPDAFLLSHAVDGYSLAFDFPVVAGRRRAVGPRAGDGRARGRGGRSVLPGQGQRAAR
jgi:FAD/FMN-containing dehydrogenase